MRGYRNILGFCLLSVIFGTAVYVLAADRTEYTVLIQKDTYQFEPTRIFIEVGDTVNWKNQDERQHLTASVPTGAGELEIFCPELFPGKSCSHTFQRAGRYPYFCFIHANMVGEVVVVQ